MAMIASGKRQRESDGSSAPSGRERDGRLVIAAFIVARIQDHMQPAWPEPLRVEWAAVERAYQYPDDEYSPDRAALFGEYRAEVTRCESVAAATVTLLLRAWRDIADFGEPGASTLGLCRRIRDHLRLVWNMRINEPPPASHIVGVASRSTRRYDLLPQRVRELST